MPLQRPEDLPRPGCPLHPRRRPGAPRRQAAAQHAEVEQQQSSWSCSSGSNWSSWAASGEWWKLEPSSSQGQALVLRGTVPAVVPSAHIRRRVPPHIAQQSSKASRAAKQSQQTGQGRAEQSRAVDQAHHHSSKLTPPPPRRPPGLCPFPCCSNSCSSSRSAARCSSSASAPPSWPGLCCTASSTARFVPPPALQWPLLCCMRVQMQQV